MFPNEIKCICQSLSFNDQSKCLLCEKQYQNVFLANTLYNQDSNEQHQTEIGKKTAKTKQHQD